jgi:alkylation response protein AidB-like acyl-CoA dehydrogenase
MEEMGRAVMPGPFFSTLLAGLAITEAGSADQKKEWLGKISDGAAKASLAWTEPSARWDAAGVTTSARNAGGKWTLTGTKLFVPDAHLADVLVVVARTSEGKRPEDGVSLFLVERGAKGLQTKLLPTMDQTRKLCEVKLEDAPATLLGAKDAGWAPLERVVQRATVALCADMLVDVENSKSLTYYAAWAVDENVPEAALASSMAKAYTSDAFRKVAGAGIQLHGGIGFTWEHDLHLYFKRAKSSEFTFGDATYHREKVAQLISL